MIKAVNADFSKQFVIIKQIFQLSGKANFATNLQWRAKFKQKREMKLLHCCTKNFYHPKQSLASWSSNLEAAHTLPVTVSALTFALLCSA